MSDCKINPDGKREEVDTETWNQYFYFSRYGDLVCGVRLYKTDEEWETTHPYIKYIKKIPYEIEVRK